MGLESYGSKSGCFEHGEKWVQKLQNRRKEELIEVQREWGAGCYEVTKHCSDHHTMSTLSPQYKCTDRSIVVMIGNSQHECKKAGKIVRIN